MHSHIDAAQVEAADLEAGLVALLQAQAALSAADARRSSLLRPLDQARHRSLPTHWRCSRDTAKIKLASVSMLLQVHTSHSNSGGASTSTTLARISLSWPKG